MNVSQAFSSSALAIVAVVGMLSTAFAQTVPVQIPVSDLTGVTWMWLRSDYSDDSSVVATDPGRYTLEFHTDNTLGIGADCNRVVGSYSQNQSQLAIRLGATTLAACPPDSQADTFLKDLGRVASYVRVGDNLVLNMQLDTGNVVLQPQVVSAPSVGRPLPTGVPWRIQEYNNGQEAVVMVVPGAPGTEPSAIFAADGSVTGTPAATHFARRTPAAVPT